MTKAARVEVWNRYACQGGTPYLAVETLLRCEGREAIDGSDAIEIDTPLSDPAVAQLIERRVLRLTLDDDSFLERRIQSVRGVHGEQGGQVTVIAVSPLLDLANGGIISETSAGGSVNYTIGLNAVTIEEVLDTYILPALDSFGQTQFEKGVIQPTHVLSPTFTRANALEWLRQLCDMARDPDTLRPAELRVRLNAAGTKYAIDVLTEIGKYEDDGTTLRDLADLRYKKNLRTTDRTRDSASQATVVSVFGDPLPNGTPTSIEGVAFRLDNEGPAGTFELTNPESPLISPVLEDAQLDDYAIVPDGANPLIEITSTVAPVGSTPAKVVLASTTGITAGNVYELRRNVLGTYLREVVSDVNLGDYERKHATVEVSGVAGIRNLAKNPFFKTWPTPTDAPTNWSVLGGGAFADFMTQETDPAYATLGGKAVKFAQASEAGPVFGLVSDPIYPQAVEGDEFLSFKARVLFETLDGTAWFYLQVRPAGGGDLIKGVTLVSPFNLVQQGESPDLGVSIDVIIANIDLRDFNDGVELHVRAGAGGGFGPDYAGEIVCHVAGVQFARHRGKPPAGFYEFSGSNALWAAGVRALRANGAPVKRYELDADDLEALDRSAYPFDQLVTGATIRLTHQPLGTAEEVRIMARPLIDYLTPARARLTVATRAQLLGEYLSTRNGSGGTQSSADTDTITPLPDPPTPPDGTPEGRPGNTGVFHFVAEGGARYVIGKHGAGRTWLDDTGHFRVPSRFAKGITVWAHVLVVGAAGSTLDVEYTINDGVSWDSTGIAVPLDSLGPKLVDATLPTAARVTEARYRAVSVDGDGVKSPELYNFAFALTVNAPESIPEPEPPTDVPVGSPWGDVVFRIKAAGDAFNALGYGDGDDVNLYPDETAFGNDMGTAAVLLLPKYRATGFGGTMPCVEWDGANVPLSTPNNPTEDYSSYTYYVVIENLDGGDGARIWGAGLGDSFQYSYYADSNHILAANNNVFGTPSISATDDWGMSGKHILRFVKTSASSSHSVWVDGVLKGSAGAAPQGNNGGTAWLMDYLGGLGLSGRVAEVVAYNQAHNSPTNTGAVANGLTGPEIALKEFWGTA